MAKVYDFTHYVELFKLVRNEFGPFSPNLWKVKSYPVSVAKQEGEAAYARIYEQFVKGTKLKKPKSWRALATIVVWTISTNPAFINDTQPHRRFAAYLAGFMSMSDIAWLESKVDSTSKCNYNIDSDREVVDNELVKSE